MEGSDKLLVGEDKNTYNTSSVLYNHTGLYFCEASNMLGILSNSTPASLIGENGLVVQHKFTHTTCQYHMLSPNWLLVHISFVAVFSRY